MDYNKEPFLPSTKPDNMSDEEYENIQSLHDQWTYQHENKIREEELWNVTQMETEMMEIILSDLYNCNEDGFCDGFPKF